MTHYFLRIPFSFPAFVAFAATCVPATSHAAQPTVSITSPTHVKEGEAVTIEVSVFDPDGTAVEWSWDTDFDGEFDEHPNAPSYTVPSTATDGPSLIRVGVRAVDEDSEERIVYRTITVENVAPRILSEPPLNASVRREYRYELTIEEPAGDLDPLEILLTSAPEGMELNGRVITWSPSPAQRGRDFPVVVRVTDGDDGEDSQMWDIRVQRNSAPTPPVPMAPVMREMVPDDQPVTLVVENGSDDDGDPLFYYFRVSRTATFEGDNVIGSGEVPEGGGATTSWTTPEPLPKGVWYWQVWVDDRIAQTEPVYAQMTVGEPGMPSGPSQPIGDGGLIPGVDAGTGGGSGGCAVSSSRVDRGGADSDGFVWLASLAFALCAARRRRGALLRLRLWGRDQ